MIVSESYRWQCSEGKVHHYNCSLNSLISLTDFEVTEEVICNDIFIVHRIQLNADVPEDANEVAGSHNEDDQFHCHETVYYNDLSSYIGVIHYHVFFLFMILVQLFHLFDVLDELWLVVVLNLHFEFAKFKKTKTFAYSKNFHSVQ